MRGSIVSYLFHVFRVVFAALAMLVVAFGLWMTVGTLVAVFIGGRFPAVIAICAITIAVATFFLGGYVSATYMTVRSWIHPCLAAVALAVIYESIFTRGDLGQQAVLIPIVAGFIAAGGAVAARLKSRGGTG